jgi:beta-N-acetylhexosaminidase
VLLRAAVALGLGLCVLGALGEREPHAATVAAGAPKPRVVWRPIPFGERRMQETADYAQRHYGIRDWRLLRPRVVVQHVTVSTTFASAYASFSADVPDSELHELPGVCTHFVVDRDGTVYQLVRESVMCRHTVGLNHTAIGVEHVGLRASDVLASRRQLESSLRLTLWLMARHGIALRDVIGHNESLTSPYRRERVAAWRCQTHGDWTRAEMDVYRARLAGLARRHRVALGPQRRAATPRC